MRKGRGAGRHPKITEKQKSAVDNIISGKARTIKKAMRQAGYSDGSSKNPGNNLLARRGVQEYVKTLNRIAQEKFGIGVKDKLALTYVEGLEATKLYGADALEAPDWQSRHKFAESVARFLNLVEQAGEGRRVQANQFNFFSVSNEEKQAINKNFTEFLKKFYQQEPVVEDVE